ncbi:MAG TPA: Holliday junction branch migration protein RuvA [Verrucomicrobia bacterium]|nr:MAG: Holliday junction DNA helicase RuvA [Lentisphaerae bacterium GWF2_57_35]HBA83631.1 Holliday junction branch migration protein RuvA [Verrucomicrobiota bacterium]
MITFLEGLLVEKEPTRVVVNVHGVGYEVFISLNSYDRLPREETSFRILTWDYVREDAHLLYGFMTAEERRMFIRLMTVSGIGPKLALTALSGLSVRDIKAAVVQGDIKRLSSISGIGKKTAERIIVELRDKLSDGEALEAVAGVEELSEGGVRMRDSILALISLGFKQADAQKLVKEVSLALGPEAPVEEIIRKSLASR